MASAADMIRRFREDMPTSRSERNSSRRSGKIGEMWWMTDNSNESMLKISSNDYDINRKREVDISSDERFYKSIIRNSNEYFPKNKIATNDRTVTKDYGRSSVNFGRESWDGFKAVEDLIANDIKRLELSTKSGGIELTSGLRSNVRKNINNNSDTYDLRISNDFLRSSHDTLGNTGFRGLLIPELKLDGKKDPVAAEPQGDVKDINAEMEELLKSLGGYNPHSLENYDLATPFSTIIQVADKLQTDLISFSTFYEKKYAQEAEEEEKRKKESEALIEEGRRAEREARNQILLDENQLPDPALDFVGLLQELDESHEFLQGPQNNPTGGIDVNRLGGIASSRLSLEEATELSRLANLPPTLPPNTDLNTTTLNHMQTLRKQLNKRINKLDDLYAIAVRKFPPQHGNRTSYNETYSSLLNHYKFPKDPLYHQQQQQQQQFNAMTGFESNLGVHWKYEWNPYPDLVHDNILTTDVAICSMLDSAMQTLHLRLPSSEALEAIEKWKTSDNYRLPIVYLDRNKPPLSMLDPEALSFMEFLQHTNNTSVLSPDPPTTLASEPVSDVDNNNNISNVNIEEIKDSAAEQAATAVAVEVAVPAVPVAVTEADLKELDALLGDDAAPPASAAEGMLSKKQELRAEDVGLPPLGPSPPPPPVLPVHLIKRRDPSAVSSLLKAREDRKRILVRRETAYHRPPSAPPLPVTVNPPNPASTLRRPLHSYDSDSSESLSSPPPAYFESRQHPPSRSYGGERSGSGGGVTIGGDSIYRPRPPEGFSLRNVRGLTKIDDDIKQIIPSTTLHVESNPWSSYITNKNSSNNHRHSDNDNRYQSSTNYYERRSPNRLNYHTTNNYTNREGNQEAILYTPMITSNGKVLVRQPLHQRIPDEVPTRNNTIQSNTSSATSSILDRQSYLKKMQDLRAGLTL